MSETLALIETSSQQLKDAVANPVSPSAGTDLFQRYIASILQNGCSTDFGAIRAYLLGNSKVFVKRAKEARNVIASVAKQLVQHSTVVLTSGTSRVVSAVLNAAADDAVSFSVIHVNESDQAALSTTNLTSSLRGKNISVTTMPLSTLANVMHKISFTMIGAESVTETGGILSSMGTRQISLLSHNFRRPLYAVAESHKFVRVFPLRLDKLAMEQDFPCGVGKDLSADVRSDFSTLPEFTPPQFITALITENGVYDPSAVAEELIKLWY